MTLRFMSAVSVALVFGLVFGAPAGPAGARLGAQQQGDRPLAFEVASIKENKTGDGRVMLQLPPGGRFTATNVSLRLLIAQAYGDGPPLPNFRIVGGPSWLDSDRFDVNAKASSEFQPSTAGPPRELMVMLRTLLEERFNL